MLLSEIVNIAINLGAGSVITLLVSKVVASRKEKTEADLTRQQIIDQQLKYLADANQRLHEALEKLQEVACYRDTCANRINGVQDSTTKHK